QRVLLDRFRLRVEQPQVGDAGLAINFHALATVQGTRRGGQDLGDQSWHALEVVTFDHAFVRSGLEVVLVRLDSVSVIKHDRHPATVLACGHSAEFAEELPEVELHVGVTLRTFPPGRVLGDLARPQIPPPEGVVQASNTSKSMGIRSSMGRGYRLISTPSNRRMDLREPSAVVVSCTVGSPPLRQRRKVAVQAAKWACATSRARNENAQRTRPSRISHLLLGTPNNNRYSRSHINHPCGQERSATDSRHACRGWDQRSPS